MKLTRMILAGAMLAAIPSGDAGPATVDGHHPHNHRLKING